MSDRVRTYRPGFFARILPRGKWKVTLRPSLPAIIQISQYGADSLACEDTAIGYSASNVTLIQTSEGSIIVDTSANPMDARAIAEAFGDRLGRPVKALIYTHNHPDHTGGATVFAGGDQPDIHSHRLLLTLGPEGGRGRRD